MQIEWDPAKNTANRRKHGISFEDISGLFAAESDCLEIYDSAHSTIEDRFIAIGRTGIGIVVVVFTERSDDCIRILSARFATRSETVRFLEYWRGGR